jgi:hypothetical protein
MGLRRGLKVVGGFAIAGFALPWLLLTFYAFAHELDWHPSINPLLYLCPSSILALGLDDASALVGLLGWLLIALRNAVLYAAIGVPFGVERGHQSEPRPERCVCGALHLPVSPSDLLLFSVCL